MNSPTDDCTELKIALDATLAEVRKMIELDSSPEGLRKARQHAFTEPARKLCVDV